jgi:hypothetical protein
MTGLVARRRQRRKRPRIAYPTTPSTIRIISTHNHPDMAASLVDAGAGRGDATAAHPGTQLGHGLAARAWIGGRAARGLAGPLHPRPARPIRAGQAGRQWMVGCARWVWARRPRRRAVGLLAGQEAKP